MAGEKRVGRQRVVREPRRALALRCCANDALCRRRGANEVAVAAEPLMDLSDREMAIGSRLVVVVRSIVSLSEVKVVLAALIGFPAFLINRSIGGGEDKVRG